MIACVKIAKIANGYSLATFLSANIYYVCMLVMFSLKKREELVG